MSDYWIGTISGSVIVFVVSAVVSTALHLWINK